jgi:hypothetical protein
MADEAHSTFRRAFLNPSVNLGSPATRDLLWAYGAFLHMERRILAHEMFPEGGPLRDLFLDTQPTTEEVERFHFPIGRDWRECPMPSTRAALVLNAVGIPVISRAAAH